MRKQHNLYILLTKTPLKTGKFIRKMTNFEYNHCSISFDENFNNLYSFTRKHKNATFYACLVKESSLRYKDNTKVKIFKIPLKQKTYRELKKYLNNLQEHENEYLYNYFSVITYPFKKRVNIKKCYTCCEFTVDILKNFCVVAGLAEKNYCGIKELSDYLNEYLIYEGDFKVNNASWGEDRYLEKIGILSKSYNVTRTFSKLIYRFLEGLIIKNNSKYY